MTITTTFLTDDIRARREFVWEWLEENYPQVFDVPQHPLLSDPEVLEQLYNSMTLEFTLTRKQKHDLRTSLALWLSDIDKYTPFPDPVAIDRAAGEFDLAVIERLSDLERSMYMDALANMADPYDDASVSWVERHEGTGVPIPVALSERRKRYDELPERERISTTRGVQRRKSS